MDYSFREEIYSLKKTPMVEMYNLAKKHMGLDDKLINFASGHPSEDIFPYKLIQKYLIEATEFGKTPSVLQYGSHIGYMPLREELKCFYGKKDGIIKQEDELAITYGATEGIFLMTLAFIRPRDRVIVEEPTYVNAIRIFRLLGAEIVAVPMESDGVSLSSLECEMKKGAQFFYTVPNFSNPSGTTMSLQKRKAVIEYAKRYNVMVLEDNPYGDLRYRNHALPSIKALDEDNKTVYVGSMSKIIAPGLRIGFVIARKELIEKMVMLKGLTSNGVSNLTQYAVWKMFGTKDMCTEIDKVCALYHAKLLQMEACMEKYFPKDVSWSSPDGGMYIWVTLPDGVDINKFCMDSATKLHVPVTPGNDFYVSKPDKCSSIRLNFVKETLEDIEHGIQQLGKLMYENI